MRDGRSPGRIVWLLAQGGAFVLVLVLALALALAACGGATRCEKAGCEASALCQPDGTCVSREALLPLSRGQATWLTPLDWGYTRADQAHEVMRDGDVLEVGGDPRAVAYLALGPIPQAPRVAQAVLQLSMHPSHDSVIEPGALVAHETRPFRGEALTHRSAPVSLGAPASEQILNVGSGPVIRLALTHAVRKAQRAQARVLYVSLHAVIDGAPPLRFASPRQEDPRTHPRLELLGP